MTTFDPAPLLDLPRFHGMTDREVGDVIGVAHETVCRWRNGRRMIRSTTADRAAVALGYHPAQLWPETWR